MRNCIRLYLDSNILVYLHEGAPEIQKIAKRILYEALENDITVHSSEITVLECLYGAFRKRDPIVLGAHRAFFANKELLKLSPVTIEILESAAQLGADYGLKTIDALHVATAVAAQCDLLITNDRRLRGPRHLTIEQFADL